MPTILVVDDSVLVRRHVRIALEAAGFQMVEAETGRIAMAKLEEAGDVALVICDVNMPDQGGLAFLEILRAGDRWRSLPVVFLTAEADPAMINRARTLAASAWVVKPFDAKKLVEITRRLTELSAVAVPA